MYLPMMALKIAAILIGNTQYPNTQIDWKKEIFPPRSFAFNVTTPAPTQIITKIIANTTSAYSFVLITSVSASIKQRRRGPHRSQFLSPYPLSSLILGKSTYFNFSPIAFKSLIIVSITGSSRV